MSTPLSKYFGEQHPETNTKLFWSKALEGIPFRGPYAPTLTKEELETQVAVEHDFHAEIFDLTDKDQNKRYHWVMDRIVNRLFVHHFIDRHVEHATGKVTVYIEWSQRYASLSPHAKAARSGANYVLPPSVKQSTPGALVLAGLQDPSTGI